MRTVFFTFNSSILVVVAQSLQSMFNDYFLLVSFLSDISSFSSFPAQPWQRDGRHPSFVRRYNRSYLSGSNCMKRHNL